jgi:hypothetical protein
MEFSSSLQVYKYRLPSRYGYTSPSNPSLRQRSARQRNYYKILKSTDQYTIQHGTMTGYATLHDGRVEQMQLQQFTNLEAGTRPLPPSHNSSAPMHTSSPNTTIASSNTREIHDLYRAARQSTYPNYPYQPAPPPSYSGPVSMPLPNLNENNNARLPAAYHGTKPRRCTCCNKFCTCGFYVIILLVLLILAVVAFIAGMIYLGSAAHAREIKGFKSDCLARGGALQTHIDEHLKKSFSCVGAGGDTVKLGD